MKIVKDNYRKTLGFTRCEKCKSVLGIENTDVRYIQRDRKMVSAFYCGACGHEQVFTRKELTSKKKAMEKVTK